MLGVVPRRVPGSKVPGGHFVPTDGVRKPYVPVIAACDVVELRHSDVVVDIGAFAGTFATRAARFPVQRVVAYEPTPTVFEVLAMNRQPNMEVVQAAVVPDSRSHVSLYVGRKLGITNSIIPGIRPRGYVRVPAVRYEDAVRGATVVKIDVEGAEYLYDVPQPGLRAVIVEQHMLTGRDWPSAVRRMDEALEGAGFSQVLRPTFANGLSTNAVWVRNLPDPGGGFMPMLSGAMCCGCGAPTQASSKALCADCWARWTPRQREGFAH